MTHMDEDSLRQQLTAIIELTQTASLDSETVARVGADRMNDLWALAVAHGDEQAQGLIQGTWEHFQALAQHNAALAGGVAGAVATGREALRQRDMAIDALADAEVDLRTITEAFENVDYDHPMVSDLADKIEADIYAESGETFYQEAYEAALENIEDNYAEGLEVATGLEHREIWRFLSALKGDYPFTEEQLPYLVWLVQSVNASVKAMQEQRQAARHG